MWKCPNCETLNEGEVCIICNEAKPAPTVNPVVRESTASYEKPGESVTPTYTPPTPPPPPVYDMGFAAKPKKNKSVIALVIIFVVVVLSVAGVVGFFEYNYRDAVSLMKSGDYDSAKSKFSSYDFYRDGASMVSECDYLKAKDYIESREYDNAKQIFMKLGYYKDSLDMVKECDYLRAVEYFEKREYSNAYDLFSTITDYRDSAQMMQEIDSLQHLDTYNKGVDAYNSGKYHEAKGYFEQVADMEDSFKYLILIDAHNEVAEFDDLMSIIDFPGAKELLMSNSRYGFGFLEGEWNSGSDYIKFYMSDGTMTSEYSLPSGFDEGEISWTIEDGVYCEYRNQESNDVFKVEISDKDSIRVYSYINRRTYVMKRR